jgi:hypothetical protein
MKDFKFVILATLFATAGLLWQQERARDERFRGVFAARYAGLVQVPVQPEAISSQAMSAGGSSSFSSAITSSVGSGSDAVTLSAGQRVRLSPTTFISGGTNSVAISTTDLDMSGNGASQHTLVAAVRWRMRTGSTNTGPASTPTYTIQGLTSDVASGVLFSFDEGNAITTNMATMSFARFRRAVDSTPVTLLDLKADGSLRMGPAQVTFTTGTGTPEGVVTAPVGSLFMRTDGAATTTLYVKTSGTGNTGWTAK